jgi:hypothetical protein
MVVAGTAAFWRFGDSERIHDLAIPNFDFFRLADGGITAPFAPRHHAIGSGEFKSTRAKQYFLWRKTGFFEQRH